GRLRQLGTPREVFGRPANTFVANFIGSTPMNLLPGTVHDGQVRVAGTTLRSVALDAGEVTVGIRPEYLTLATSGPAGAALHGEVAVVEHLGAVSLVSVAVGDLLIGATVPEELEPAPGAAVWLTPNPDRVLVYGAADGELLL